MSGRTLAQKMMLRAPARVLIIDPPPAVRLELPDGLTDAYAGEADHIHLFVTRRDDLGAAFPRLRELLAPRGRLWVSWPKGGRCGTELSLAEVVRIGYHHGLVESTCVSVDATWSALKFTRPKPGKVYRNSHAELRQVG